MNILDLTEKVKTGKRTGRKFTHESGAVFEIRRISFKELPSIMEWAASANDDSVNAFEKLQDRVNRLLDLHLVIGWENFTVGMLAKMVQVQMPETELNDEIPVDSPESNAELIKAICEKDLNFLHFVSNCVTDSINVQNEEAAKKNVIS